MGSNGLALGSEHSPASARFAEYCFNSGLLWHERHDLNRMSRWGQIDWCCYWIKPTPRKKSCGVSQMYVVDTKQNLSSLRTILHHSSFFLIKGERTPNKKKKKKQKKKMHCRFSAFQMNHQLWKMSYLKNLANICEKAPGQAAYTPQACLSLGWAALWMHRGYISGI